MTLNHACEQCARQYELPTALAGRQAKCKTCGYMMRFPAAESSLPKIAAKRAKPPLQTFTVASSPPGSKPPLQTFGSLPIAAPRSEAPRTPPSRHPAFDDDDGDPYEIAEVIKPSADLEDDELPDPDTARPTKRPGRVRPSTSSSRAVPAGLTKRWLASVVDNFLILILYVISLVIVIPGAVQMNLLSSPFSIVVILVLDFFVISIAYMTLLTARSSRATPGKSLVGIQVVTDRGKQIGLAHSLIRAGMQVSASFLPPLFFLNVIMALGSHDGRTLYDRLSQTQVIRSD